MSSRRARSLGVLAVLGVAALLWWWDPVPRGTTAAPHTDPADLGGSSAMQHDADSAEELLAGASPEVDAATPSPLQAAKVCSPRAELACHAGDVYWLDACGRPGELVESCGDRGCDAAHCGPPSPDFACGNVTAYGNCAGQVAEACIAGRIVRVDCASRRQRCVMTSEGAACLPFDAKLGCQGHEPASCEGNQLRLCVDGYFRTLDCAARGATCNATGAQAHCEAVGSPIGLAPVPPSGELCDGKDNDGDQQVDEDGACDTIPLVAFVPQGFQPANIEERLARELSILNQMYSPIQFRWAVTRDAPASYRELDMQYMEIAARDLSQRLSKTHHPSLAAARAPNGDEAGFDFYIPVLYVEKLDMAPPKAGVSTLPNATCGGVRVSDAPSPVSGLIVVTEARQPETLAHEMGHYLGLCHTHEQLERFSVVRGDAASCDQSGDGICDTPVDPGAQSCFRAEVCELQCHAGEHPDAFNVMSYYFGCRRALSAEQRAEVARNLRLRRGWFRCQDPADCPCDPSLKNACPDDMSCHPSGSASSAFLCELDGPGAPGTACRSASQCSARAFCLSTGHGGAAARCVRPCDGEPGCTCLDVGLPTRICAQDLE